MAGQFRGVKAVAEAQHVQMMTHEQFRLRVFRADFAHVFAAFFWRDGIHVCEMMCVKSQFINIAWILDKNYEKT